MELENQVVSLELAKKMKELEFEQESCFWWFPFGGGVREWHISYLENDMREGWRTYRKNKPDSDFYAAYTVAELGILLGRWGKPQLHNGIWIGELRGGACGQIVTDEFKAETEVEARAKMLIYLKENNLI